MNRGDSGGGSSRSSTDHSVFLGQSNEMTHSIKLVDKNWHWEDKAMDVRTPLTLTRSIFLILSLSLSLSQYLLEQSDFLVVGVIGKQGVGKSTVMSLLAGTRTGSGK